MKDKFSPWRERLIYTDPEPLPGGGKFAIYAIVRQRYGTAKRLRDRKATKQRRADDKNIY